MLTWRSLQILLIRFQYARMLAGNVLRYPHALSCFTCTQVYCRKLITTSTAAFDEGDTCLVPPVMIRFGLFKRRKVQLVVHSESWDSDVDNFHSWVLSCGSMLCISNMNHVLVISGKWLIDFVPVGIGEREKNKKKKMRERKRGGRVEICIVAHTSGSNVWKPGCHQAAASEAEWCSSCGVAFERCRCVVSRN